MKMLTMLSVCTLLFGLAANAETTQTIKNTNRKIAAETSFKCSGTEPFWSVQIKNGKMEYMDPSISKTIVNKITAQQQTAGSNIGVVYTSKKKNSQDLAIVKIASCSDGMSDNNYDYDISYITIDKNGNPSFLTGCCTEIK